jgi:protein tyrosine phosphatase (PTP) superfamily phosphohydrolase (DUF442 family)
MTRRFALATILTTTIWITASAHGETAGSAGTSAPVPIVYGSMQRIHKVGGVLLAGQPSPDDLRLARSRGVRSVVNLRQASELDWDEGKCVAQLGMQYHHVPFKSPTSLTDQVFDKVRQLLNDTSHRPMILHCASANRVGAVWLVHRIIDEGLSYDAALAESKAVGLRSAQYQQAAENYLRRTLARTTLQR